MSNVADVQGYIYKQAPKEYLSILETVQEYINNNCWELHQTKGSKKDKKEKIMSFIHKFIKDKSTTCTNFSELELITKLYSDINEFSVLTDALEDETVEEININAWNNIQAKLGSGKLIRLSPFASPGQAVDILQKLLQQSGVTIDKGRPEAEAHIGSRIRIAALINPLVDADVGVACSIRKLSKRVFTKEKYLANDFASAEELEFLTSCLRYGASTIVAGKVNSGKTTFENYLLSNIPNEKRIYTIESGARELNLVRCDENGIPINNVVHTLTRPSENKLEDITQEKLVVKALRFDPDIIVVAEMRDIEAYAGQEASLTGHTVVTSLHAGSPKQAHNRVANLCRKLYPIDYQTALIQACSAFPIVVFVHQTDDYVRRIMEVSEVVVDGTNIRYNPLYKYKVLSNEVVDGVTVTRGEHLKVGIPSTDLVELFSNNSMPSSQIEKFTGGTA